MQTKQQTSYYTSLTELENVFLITLKGLRDHDSEQTPFDNLDLFESAEANQKIRVKLNEFLDFEKNYWSMITLLKVTRDNAKDNTMENMKSCYKVIQELVTDNKGKGISITKDLLPHLKLVMIIKESLLDIYKSFIEGFAHINTDEKIKIIQKRLENLPKIYTSKDTSHMSSYFKLLECELKSLSQLFNLIKALHNMEFMNSLIALSNLKSVVEDFKAKKRENLIELEKEKTLTYELFMLYDHAHLHFASKIWLYFRELLQVSTPFPKSEKTKHSNLLVEMLQNFEASNPDSYLYLVAEGINLTNPFKTVDIAESPKSLLFIKPVGKHLLLYGQPDETKDSPLQTVLMMIEESYELLSSYLNKSSEIRTNNNFQNYLLSKVDGRVYLGFMAKNYRGKKLEKCLNKLIKLIDILRNNQMFLVPEYNGIIESS